jgi:hypothetical protein
VGPDGSGETPMKLLLALIAVKLVLYTVTVGFQ